MSARTATATAATAPPGYDYGNARVRAMWGRLLDRPAYDRMLGLDAERMLELLAAGEHGPDVRYALGRARGVSAIHMAVRRNLSRSLIAVRSFYGGDAGLAVNVVLSRWDVANVVALLRAQAVEADVDDAVSMVVAAGTIDEAAAREIAGQPGLRAAAGLLAAWSVPDDRTALAALRGIAAYEATGDLAMLEEEVLRAWAAQMDEELARLGRAGAPLDALREEVDQRNALLALRVRALPRLRSAGTEAPTRERFVPGGLIDRRVFPVAAAAASPGDAAAVLAGPTAAAPWRPALTRWVADGDLSRLQRELQVSHTLRTMALFRSGDPLGVAVPLAYVFAKENEARNVRIVAYGGASGVPPAVIRDQVVAPW